MPFFTTDQNESDACPWVTTSIEMSLSTEPPPELSASSFPPSSPHAGRTRTPTTIKTASSLRFVMLVPPFRWDLLRTPGDRSWARGPVVDVQLEPEVLDAPPHGIHRP